MNSGEDFRFYELMDPMNPRMFIHGHPPYFQAPQLPQLPPPSASFWTPANVQGRIKDLRKTIDLSVALQKELEMLIKLKERDSAVGGGCTEHYDASLDMFSKFMKHHKIDMEYQESLSLNAANSIMSKLRIQLEPFKIVVDENTPWEEKSALKGLAYKAEKYKRNKLWRKRKRRRVAENLAQERKKFEQVNKEADEWRAREIAKDIAQHKIEKMKEIARKKGKEEKKRLQSELDLVLIVEKLQELRKIRIEKMKKQGHFLPEEDDKFLERVRAAVEEEERQLKAAADTEAAKDAIAAAEESRKTISIKNQAVETKEKELSTPSEDQKNVKNVETMKGPEEPETAGQFPESSYTYISQLPLEFYHYYHGSNTDLGTLIEVRRQWDAFLRPGGSRIPGHWVQPSPPADDVWASYLVRK